MKLKLIAATIVFSAASLTAGSAFAQQQSVNATAPVAQGQSQASAPANARGGFGNFGTTSLMCLEWHCQGSECICIRFTTAQVVQN